MTDVTQDQGQAGAELSAADEQVLRELTERARTGGLKLTGQGGLLGRLTKMVVEGALEGELDDHLGYGKHDPEGRDGGNSRNGHRAKTVLTDTGPVEISVPRDRDASFEPKIIAKRQRRLTGVDEIVISLSAKGLTHGEIAAHLAEVYGAEVSKQTITTITDRVMEGMAEWQSRPLDAVYAVVFIDAINVKIREGQVANRPVYLALGVTVDGERDVLGLWAGEHGDGEGAKYWMRVCSEIKNRGTRDVLMVVCDGLKGLPDAVNAVWEKTIVQTCIVHLLRNSFKYASKKDWAQIAKDLKPVYTAASESEALDRFAEFSGKWEKRYPAIIRLWENVWAEFVPFLRFDREIRTVICTTNAIESINARPFTGCQAWPLDHDPWFLITESVLQVRSRSDYRVEGAGFHVPAGAPSWVVGPAVLGQGVGGRALTVRQALIRSLVQGQSARRCSQRFRWPRVRRAGTCSSRNRSSFGAASRNSPAGRARWRKQASRFAARATIWVQATLIVQCRDGHRFRPSALACLTSFSTWTWERWRASSQASCPARVLVATS